MKDAALLKRPSTMRASTAKPVVGGLDQSVVGFPCSKNDRQSDHSFEADKAASTSVPVRSRTRAIPSRCSEKEGVDDVAARRASRWLELGGFEMWFYDSELGRR